MSSQLWWYVARAGGIVALALTGLSVIYGLLLSSGLLDRHPSKKWLLSLHRWLGGLAVTFTGVHLLGLVADSYLSFGLLDVLVPLASAWNPIGVAWGVITMWLLVAVQVTSLLMRRLPRQWWKRIHLASFGLFLTGIVHGAMAGSDASHPLYVVGVVTMVLVTVFLTAYRVLTGRLRSTTRPAPVGAAP